MKYTSWKVTFWASVASAATIGMFLLGGNAATFAKTVYVFLCALGVLLIGLVPASSAKKDKPWQTAVGAALSIAEISALIYIGSPFIAAFAFFATTYTKIVRKYKSENNEKELAQEE